MNHTNKFNITTSSKYTSIVIINELLNGNYENVYTLMLTLPNQPDISLNQTLTEITGTLNEMNLLGQINEKTMKKAKSDLFEIALLANNTDKIPLEIARKELNDLNPPIPSGDRGR